MKKLYISDLDGTLLTNSATLSKYTTDTLNSLIDKDLNFTYSTARTSATAPIITKNINIKLPVILMNGVCIYNQITRKFINVCVIENNAKNNILDILNKYNLNCFMFKLENHILNSLYENITTQYMQNFHDERVLKFNKSFIKTSNLKNIDDAIYISVFHKKEFLEKAYFELKNISDIEIAFYKDSYNADLWYLEMSSIKASKYNSALFLKDKYSFDEVIGFGDNLNDIPLFKACDRCYAVENAKEELKKIATGVIDYNQNNAVANFLLTEI